MAAAPSAAAGETDSRALGRSHPEAEMVAATRGSDGTPVKLCVTNVYNSSSSEVVSLETTSTISDLKTLLQEKISSRPAPHQQRLIFRGKQCEETQQLGHVLRGLDLSSRHTMHLIVSPSIEQPPASDSSTADVQRNPIAQPLSQQPPQQPRLPSRGSSAHVAPPVDAAATAATASNSNGQPERIHLSQTQLGQLQWQFQQALRENQKALDEHRQRFHFLSAQSRALARQQQQYQHRRPTVTYRRDRDRDPLPQRHQHHYQQQYHTEVSTRAATRALGGNMPGPTRGGGVRDVTGPPPEGHIPAAGLGEDGEAGRGNVVDPAPRAPDIGREARRWFKMMLQCMGVIMVFGIDANGWVLAFLALGGLVVFLFRTGLLKEMLGGRREGGGLWKKLCTGATVVMEGGGILMDTRYFFSAFIFSLFPTWQPVRSPEAIAAEAAAQALAQAQAQEAAVLAARRVQAVQAVQETADSAAAATAGRATNATPAEQGGEGADRATDAMSVAQGADAATMNHRSMNASAAEEEVDPAALD